MFTIWCSRRNINLILFLKMYLIFSFYFKIISEMLRIPCGWYSSIHYSNVYIQNKGRLKNDSKYGKDQLLTFFLWDNVTYNVTSSRKRTSVDRREMNWINVENLLCIMKYLFTDLEWYKVYVELSIWHEIICNIRYLTK